MSPFGSADITLMGAIIEPALTTDFRIYGSLAFQIDFFLLPSSSEMHCRPLRSVGCSGEREKIHSECLSPSLFSLSMPLLLLLSEKAFNWVGRKLNGKTKELSCAVVSCSDVDHSGSLRA